MLRSNCHRVDTRFALRYSQCRQQRQGGGEIEEASEHQAAGADSLQDQVRASEQSAARLPGLWLVCVLFGFLGAVSTYHVFVRDLFVPDPPTPVLPAIMALVFFAVATGLWLRWNPARFVAIACMLIGFLFWLVVLCRFGFYKGGPGPFFVSAWAVIAAYLFALGKHFRGSSARGPGFFSLSFAAAVVTVVLLFLRGLVNEASWVV